MLFAVQDVFSHISEVAQHLKKMQVTLLTVLVLGKHHIHGKGFAVWMHCVVECVEMRGAVTVHTHFPFQNGVDNGCRFEFRLLSATKHFRDRIPEKEFSSKNSFEGRLFQSLLHFFASNPDEINDVGQ